MNTVEDQRSAHVLWIDEGEVTYVSVTFATEGMVYKIQGKISPSNM